MFERSTEDNHFTTKCISTITWLIEYCLWSSVRSIKSIKIVRPAPPRIRILKSPHPTAFEVFVGGIQVKSSQNIKQFHFPKFLCQLLFFNYKNEEHICRVLSPTGLFKKWQCKTIIKVKITFKVFSKLETGTFPSLEAVVELVDHAIRCRCTEPGPFQQRAVILLFYLFIYLIIPLERTVI